MKRASWVACDWTDAKLNVQLQIPQIFEEVSNNEGAGVYPLAAPFADTQPAPLIEAPTRNRGWPADRAAIRPAST